MELQVGSCIPSTEDRSSANLRNLYETSIPPNWPKWPLASIFSISSGCGLRVKVQV